MANAGPAKIFRFGRLLGKRNLFDEIKESKEWCGALKTKKEAKNDPGYRLKGLKHKRDQAEEVVVHKERRDPDAQRLVLTVTGHQVQQTQSTTPNNNGF
jgi:hypothetical protein